MPLNRDELMEFLISLPWKKDAAGYAIIKRSHVVLWANGRVVGPKELVHHKNRNKADDRPENLEVMTKSEHAKEHVHEKLANARRNYTPERRAAISELHRGNQYNVGRKMTDEQRVAHGKMMKQVWIERREGKRATPDIFNNQERKNQLLQ